MAEQEIIKLAVSQGIWAALFVVLLFYVLRESAAREKRLTDTLNKVADQLATDVREVKADVDQLKDDVHDLASATRR